MSAANTKKDDLDDDERPIDPRYAVRVTRKNKGKERIPLWGARVALGKTQQEVALALGINQSEVSRLERRPEIGLATLRRYAEALGARCELAIVLENGTRMLIADPEPEPER